MMYYSIKPSEDKVMVELGNFVSKEAAITHIQCSWPERIGSVILDEQEYTRMLHFLPLPPGVASRRSRSLSSTSS